MKKGRAAARARRKKTPVSGPYAGLGTDYLHSRSMNRQVRHPKSVIVAKLEPDEVQRMIDRARSLKGTRG